MENKIMETIKIGNAFVAERYIDEGVSYIRLKYNDKYRTEVIMQEKEFVKMYGEFNGWEIIHKIRFQSRKWRGNYVRMERN